MEELFKLFKQDLEDRVTWEQRQATAYKLRFGQVRRRLRPYPHAADLTWPLIDTAVERRKPADYEQIFGPDLIASFAAKNPLNGAFTTEVAQWFDWRTKHRSNYEKQMLHVIDTKNNNGKAFLKTYYSQEHDRVEHQCIYPTMLIAPVSTEELADAERCCHVMQITRQRYERVAKAYNYNPDKAFIDRIVGRDKDDSYHQAKDLREGLGWVKQKQNIVLWEGYERSASGINVHTFSPMLPNEPVRPAFMLPYTHKFTKNKIPIVQYDFEITDVGFYSPRGLAEILQLPQSILKMLLDMEMDYYISCNRPIWQPAENAPAGNYNNMRLAPGQVINERLQALAMPTPALSFSEAQEKIRTMSQERVASPDYGIGDENQSGRGKKTATEVAQLGAVKESGVNLGARIFGMSVTQTLRLAFGLEVQFFNDDFTYFYKHEFAELNQEALKHEYELEVNASKDGFSREKDLQKLIQVRQLLYGQPHFVIAACDKKILELVNPDLIKDLYRDPNEANADEILREYDEIQAMINGAEVQVKPSDDDKARIQAIETFLQYIQGHPDKHLLPDVMLRIFAHEDQHIEQLKQKEPDFFKANAQQFQGILRRNKMLASTIMQQAQQQMMAQQNSQGAATGPSLAQGPAPAGAAALPGAPPGMLPAGQPPQIGQ